LYIPVGNALVYSGVVGSTRIGTAAATVSLVNNNLMVGVGPLKPIDNIKNSVLQLGYIALTFNLPRLKASLKKIAATTLAN